MVLSATVDMDFGGASGPVLGHFVVDTVPQMFLIAYYKEGGGLKRALEDDASCP